MVIKIVFDCSPTETIVRTYPDFSIWEELPREKIRVIDCPKQDLSKLPSLDDCVSLISLFCEGNNLTSIPDMSNCKKLKYVRCGDNQINSLLILSECLDLIELKCENNRLVYLPELGKCSQLEKFICDNNWLERLPDLSTCRRLYYFSCKNNMISALPPLPSQSLQYIHCSYNKITCLPNLLKFYDLIELKCDHNWIRTFPDLPWEMLEIPTIETKLENVDISYNQLAEIPVNKKYRRLDKFYYHNNKICINRYGDCFYSTPSGRSDLDYHNYANRLKHEKIDEYYKRDYYLKVIKIPFNITIKHMIVSFI